MKILVGEIQPDTGTVSKSEGTLAAYLPQTGISFGSKTPPEEVEDAFDRFRLLEDEKTRLAAQMNGHDAGWEEKAHRIHEIEEILLACGYHHRRDRIDRVLKGLGFKTSDLSSFSGGWQMRIALARILLMQPQILLLDEPTNYLDIESREWLAGFLEKYDGGVLLISHDRWFLDETVSETYELFNGRLKRYKGNYSAYEKQRKEEIDLLIRQAKIQQEEIERSKQYRKTSKKFISVFRRRPAAAKMR